MKKKKLYASLVTARPPVEIAGHSVDASLQELSSYKPSVVVPQEDTPLAERERALLLYDAALTPPDMPGTYGLPSWALDTVRLVRAAQMAEKFGKLPEGSGNAGMTPDEMNRFTSHLGRYGHSGVQYDAALTRVYAANGDDNMSRTRIGELLANQDLTSWDNAVNAARSIAAMAEREPQVPPPPKGPGDGEGEGEDEGGKGNKPSMVRVNADESDPAEPKDESSFDKVVKEALIPSRTTGKMPKQLASLASKSFDPWKQGGHPPLGPNGEAWGKLLNADKPDALRMESRKRKRGARRRPELEGAFPRAFHRLSLDGKIFRGAPMRGGFRGRGTVLVDMSGSMAWTEESFQTLLEALPECTVLGYSGDLNCKTGRLVMLADRGRMANLDAVGRWNSGRGLNIVDGPALQLLARMSKPRIWISDGRVTGHGEHHSQELINQANAILLTAGIVRVRYAAEASKLLLGR